MSVLGEALFAQSKLKEAEPLLLAGYEGMKAKEETIPEDAATRIPDSLDRLIKLYTALEQPEEVAKYKELREQYADQFPC